MHFFRHLISFSLDHFTFFRQQIICLRFYSNSLCQGENHGKWQEEIWP